MIHSVFNCCSEEPLLSDLWPILNFKISHILVEFCSTWNIVKQFNTFYFFLLDIIHDS